MSSLTLIAADTKRKAIIAMQENRLTTANTHVKNASQIHALVTPFDLANEIVSHWNKRANFEKHEIIELVVNTTLQEVLTPRYREAFNQAITQSTPSFTTVAIPEGMIAS